MVGFPASMSVRAVLTIALPATSPTSLVVGILGKIGMSLWASGKRFVFVLLKEAGELLRERRLLWALRADPAHSFPGACPATSFSVLTASAIDIGIRGIERMPVQAVGFRTVGGGGRFASHDVFSWGNGFKMVWIDTGRISTQVIEAAPNWNRPVCPFVCDSVSAPASPIEKEQPVTPALSSRPDPATIGRTLLYFAPESFFYRFVCHTKAASDYRFNSGACFSFGVP